jgi:hypothetical protein
MSCRLQAVPFNDDCTEWFDNVHFNGGRTAARKYRFNSDEGCYQWVETGPIIVDRDGRYESGQLVRIPGGWAVGRVTRGIKDHKWSGRGLRWLRIGDPFAPAGRSNVSEPIICSEPATQAPANFYVCPDGVLRLLSGDGTKSPYGNERDPLYIWDIDPEDGFRASNRRVVYDTVQVGLPIRTGAMPKVDMCKLLPCQGKTQYAVHRVTVTNMLQEHVHTRPNFWMFPPINQVEKDSCAIYYAAITYEGELSTAWAFPEKKERQRIAKVG